MARSCRYSVILIVVLAAGLAGCGIQERPDTHPAPDFVSDGLAFDERLLEIASSYESYQRMGPEEEMRVAPVACAPVGRRPGILALGYSNSTDSATHGRKLYSVFVRNLPAWPRWDVYVVRGGPNPVGQVVVKESWVAEEVPDDGKPLKPKAKQTQGNGGAEPLPDISEEFVPYARHEGRLYHAASKSALFIMYKLEPGTPGTDEGWVYGTVTPDGKQVTSAGRVESCMGCHRDAPHDRLFGLAKK
jgi:hypothetical protein